MRNNFEDNVISVLRRTLEARGISGLSVCMRDIMYLQLINIRGTASLSAQVEEVIREVCLGRCALEKLRSVLQHLSERRHPEGF
jgi:hypothetical protein